MDDVIGIIKKVEGLLDTMYVLGKAEGTKVKTDMVEEARTRGFDDGYEEGWNEAKTHFRVPDL